MQIVAMLKTGASAENLGDLTNGEAKVLTFTAKASIANSMRVYIMCILCLMERPTQTFPWTPLQSWLYRC
jgi:hypothetical protein